jgi:hypothetical protein
MAAAGLETSLYHIGRPEVKYASHKYINIMLYSRSDQG